jgi:hypothetical protein
LTAIGIQDRLHEIRHLEPGFHFCFKRGLSSANGRQSFQDIADPPARHDDDSIAVTDARCRRINSGHHP